MMNLQLIEQACGCSMVRGEDRLTVRDCLYLWRVLAARTMHLHLQDGGFAIATEAAMNFQLIEQACGCSMVRGETDSRCVIVSACGECLPPGPCTCTCRWS